MSEAARQQALLAAIGRGAGAGGEPLPALSLSPARAARGLAAYRANAQVLAHRALAAACPTVEAMVGTDQLAGLAAAFWQAHPPTCGDIGEWGQALPDWLSARPDLADWPWLADAARLDLAVHHAERAADAEMDTASLVLLGEHDPAVLHLVLMPGTALIRSVYPVVTLRECHQGHPAHGDDTPADALQRARAGLLNGLAENALVWRRGWRCEVVSLNEADAAFTAQLLAGHNLAAALAAAHADFDFGPWLQRAVAHAWLKGVGLIPD